MQYLTPDIYRAHWGGLRLGLVTLGGLPLVPTGQWSRKLRQSQERGLSFTC